MMSYPQHSAVYNALALGLSALLLSTAALAAPADAQGQSLAAAKSRLDALHTAGVPADNYNWAKAKCWLEAANTAYSENDRSGFGGQAQQEAEQLLSALEADKNTAPRYGVPAAASLRPDLQAKLKDLQAQGGAKCGAQNLACADVQLARAAHELNRFGRKAAAPYAYIAQCAVDEAQKQIAACAPAPQVAVPAPARLQLGTDGLFRFDKSDLQDLLPESRSKIDAFAQSIKSWNKLDGLKITGHTDRLGDAAYNQRLSLARAETVRKYLQNQQLPMPTEAGIVVQGMGASQPVTKAGQCPSSLSPAALIACLQPDRRIDVEVSGTQDRP